MPAVSVILPVYNVAAYVEECIESIKAQTLRDAELIVVDDCGQDDSMARIHRLLDAGTTAFPVRYLRHTHNRGLSAARNTGLAEATGRYVYYADSDDTLPPDALATLLEAAERTEADVAIGNLRVEGDGTWIQRLDVPQETVVEGQPDVLHAYMLGKWYVMAWNKLCRRDFLLRHRLAFVEGLVHEDVPWSFSMACHARRVVLCPAETYVYRIRENSLQTGRDFTRHYDAYCRILQAVADTAIDVTASGHNLLGDGLFRWWYERMKALYFQMTLAEGDVTQQRELYHLVRRLLPFRRAGKAYIHYALPFPVAYPTYRKMHRHLLC